MKNVYDSLVIENKQMQESGFVPWTEFLACVEVQER